MTSKFTVLVCGGRNYSDKLRMKKVLDTLHELLKQRNEEMFLISGGANGADTLAHEWALSMGVAHKIYPANWSMHGRSAGPIRNQQMLSEGKPDYVIAFAGGRGTENMIAIARKAGVTVREI